MHNLVELATTIRDAIVHHTGKPTKLKACTERFPNYRTYIVLADHSENERGTRYLVTEENGECTVQEITFLTPQLLWSLCMKETEPRKCEVQHE